MLYQSLIKHKHKTRTWKDQKQNYWVDYFWESSTNVSQSAVIFETSIYKVLYGERGKFAHPPCRTLLNSTNFQIDGASQYFGVWLWKLVQLLLLVCSFQWCVLILCLAKIYRNYTIRDKGLFSLGDLHGKANDRTLWSLQDESLPEKLHWHQSDAETCTILFL